MWAVSSFVLTCFGERTPGAGLIYAREVMHLLKAAAVLYSMATMTFADMLNRASNCGFHRYCSRVM